MHRYSLCGRTAASVPPLSVCDYPEAVASSCYLYQQGGGYVIVLSVCVIL